MSNFQYKPSTSMCKPSPLPYSVLPSNPIHLRNHPLSSVHLSSFPQNSFLPRSYTINSTTRPVENPTYNPTDTSFQLPSLFPAPLQLSGWFLDLVSSQNTPIAKCLFSILNHQPQLLHIFANLPNTWQPPNKTIHRSLKP